MKMDGQCFVVGGGQKQTKRSEIILIAVILSRKKKKKKLGGVNSRYYSLRELVRGACARQGQFYIFSLAPPFPSSSSSLAAAVVMVQQREKTRLDSTYIYSLSHKADETGGRARRGSIRMQGRRRKDVESEGNNPKKKKKKKKCNLECGWVPRSSLSYTHGHIGQQKNDRKGRPCVPYTTPPPPAKKKKKRSVKERKKKIKTNFFFSRQ